MANSEVDSEIASAMGGDSEQSPIQRRRSGARSSSSVDILFRRPIESPLSAFQRANIYNNTIPTTADALSYNSKRETPRLHEEDDNENIVRLPENSSELQVAVQDNPRIISPFPRLGSVSQTATTPPTESALNNIESAQRASSAALQENGFPDAENIALAATVV